MEIPAERFATNFMRKNSFGKDPAQQYNPCGYRPTNLSRKLRHITGLIMTLPTAQAPKQEQEDRRRAPRRRTLKAAKILLLDSTAVFDCTVRDISVSGARVTLGHFQPLPRRFCLDIVDIGSFYCEVVRASEREYGVRFVTKDGEPLSPQER